MSASNVAAGVDVGIEVTIVLHGETRQVRSVDVSAHTFTVYGQGPLQCRFWFNEEGQTWARGWDTEDAHALEAAMLLVASAE